MPIVFSERLRSAFAPPKYLALPLAGIDLSTSGVKAVRLSEGPHGLILERYVEARLPAGAFVDGDIIDRAAVIEALTVAVKATGISSANVSLPESKSYLFETKAVGTDKAELRTSIEQHLDEFVPLPPSETVFDFVKVGRDDSGEVLVASVGFARRIIDDTLSVFDDAGIRVQSLEGEVFASSRALLPLGDDSTVLIIDVGKTATKISIVARRIPRFATTIAIGGHALTLAVQKYFGVTEDEARQVKSERGIVPTPGNEEYLAAMLSTVSAIRDEISRHLNYWQERATHDGVHDPVSRVLLIGGNAAVRGLPEYLEGALQIPVTAGDVFTNFSSRDTWIPSLDYSESFAYATAIGLALRDHSASHTLGELTNLLPQPRRHLLSREHHFRLGVVVLSLLISLILCAAVLLVPMYVFLMGSAQAKETQLTSVKSVLSSSDEAALSARLTNLSNEATILSELAKKTSVSDTIRTVLDIPRSGITLSGIAFAPAANKNLNAVALTGTATTRDTLRTYQLALQNAAFARTVDLPVSAYAKDTNIAFTITITLAP